MQRVVGETKDWTTAEEEEIVHGRIANRSVGDTVTRVNERNRRRILNGSREAKILRTGLGRNREIKSSSTRKKSPINPPSLVIDIGPGLNLRTPPNIAVVARRATRIKTRAAINLANLLMEGEGVVEVVGRLRVMREMMSVRPMRLVKSATRRKRSSRRKSGIVIAIAIAKRITIRIRTKMIMLMATIQRQSESHDPRTMQRFRHCHLFPLILTFWIRFSSSGSRKRKPKEERSSRSKRERAD
jgi:hypothetical protein